MREIMGVISYSGCEEHNKRVLSDLKESLLGKTMSLSDMDAGACAITECDEPSLACGDYYEINEMPVGEEWAYGYGKSGGLEGCFLVDFQILEKPEYIEDWSDIEDVLIKVVDVLLA